MYAYGGEEDESHSILSVDYNSLSSDSGEDLEKMAQLASLLKAGQYEKAITLLDHFEVSGGNNPNFGLVKAQIALMKDDLPLAREYARRTIKVAKDFVRGYKFLAYVYMLMEDWRRAKIVLLAALEQTEDDVEVYILASYAFQGDGDSARRRGCWRKPLWSIPSRLLRLRNWGSHYLLKAALRDR